MPGANHLWRHLLFACSRALCNSGYFPEFLQLRVWAFLPPWPTEGNGASGSSVGLPSFSCLRDTTQISCAPKLIGPSQDVRVIKPCWRVRCSANTISIGVNVLASAHVLMTELYFSSSVVWDSKSVPPRRLRKMKGGGSVNTRSTVPEMVQVSLSTFMTLTRNGHPLDGKNENSCS